MPRYFFSASDSAQADDMGLDLSDPQAARRYAIQYAGDLISDQPELLDSGELSISVTDERQQLLFTVKASGLPPAIRRLE